MSRKFSIIVLLCIAALLPSIATAQEFTIFAKQKVVVADIRDMNDRHLSDGLKQCIRQGIIDACTKSSDYEVYEINIEDVKRQLIASGQKVSFSAICNAIGKRADYIIFTNVKLSSSEVGAQNITIYITSSLYRIATGSEMKTRFAEAAPTSSSVLSATSKLVSELLGINISAQSQSSQGIRSSTSYQQSYQQPAYSQPVQPITSSHSNNDTFFAGLNVIAYKGEIECNGIYTLSDDGANTKFLKIIPTNFNRYDFGYSLEFFPKEGDKSRILLSLSRGWRVFNIEFKNGVIYIYTDNGRHSYNTGIVYNMYSWNKLVLRYKNGVVYINDKVITDVIMNKVDGDNEITSMNYSCGDAFYGIIRNLKVYN